MPLWFFLLTRCLLFLNEVLSSLSLVLGAGAWDPSLPSTRSLLLLELRWLGSVICLDAAFSELVTISLVDALLNSTVPWALKLRLPTNRLSRTFFFFWKHEINICSLSLFKNTATCSGEQLQTSAIDSGLVPTTSF